MTAADAVGRGGSGTSTTIDSTGGSPAVPPSLNVSTRLRFGRRPATQETSPATLGNAPPQPVTTLTYCTPFTR